MPTAIFMNRLLMVIFANFLAIYSFICTIRPFRLTHKETEHCASVHFPV